MYNQSNITKLGPDLSKLEQSILNSLDNLKSVKQKLHLLMRLETAVYNAMNESEMDPLESNAGFADKLKKYAVISVNINAASGYFFHLPFVLLTWRRVGYEPLFIIVTSNLTQVPSENEFTLKVLVEQLKARVFYFKTKETFETTSAQISREMVGLLPNSYVTDEDFVITSDADLYPIKRVHYEVTDDENIKVWNADCCGLFKHQEKNYTMYPMGRLVFWLLA